MILFIIGCFPRWDDYTHADFDDMTLQELDYVIL